MHDVARNGKVHVMAEMCTTCVFRPGNLMSLRTGRLKDMIATATEVNSTIVCHQTLDKNPTGGNAACRGFFDRHKTQSLQVAERLGLITEVHT
jgi:hypothetical protein